MTLSTDVIILAVIAIAVVLLVYTVSKLVRRPEDGDVGLTAQQKYQMEQYQKWRSEGAQQVYRSLHPSNFCPYCGKKDLQGAFCAHCGKKLR